jgi:hypothetical protein
MNYKRILKTLKITGIIISVICIISLLFILFNPAFINFSYKINVDLADKFGELVGGFIGTLFSLITAILILYTFIHQKLEIKRQQAENHFFKMLEFHNDNVKNMSVRHIYQQKKDEISMGRRAFVIFKLQILKLVKVVQKINTDLNLNLSDTDIIDISYIAFYYGIDRDWQSFTKERLIKYPRGAEISDRLLKKKEKIYSKIRLGRTNQTSLSSYYRNMYRAIKYIDCQNIFSREEKEKYIKIYRAQLSNPELFVLFFNVTSRFGLKWKQNTYITRYEFLRNIPNNYCKPFNHKVIFPMKYEEDEIN